MSDPLEHAKQWAAAIDSSRTHREPSGAETVFPVCAAAVGFFLFFGGHAVIVAQPYTFSVVEWLIAVPAYSCVAIVAAVWPDRAAVAACISLVWAFVSTSLLFLFALAGTDGHSDWKVVFPWPLVVIPTVTASLAGYVGAQVGEFLKEKSRRRRSSRG